jgi:hypothetical protein
MTVCVTAIVSLPMRVALIVHAIVAVSLSNLQAVRCAFDIKISPVKLYRWLLFLGTLFIYPWLCSDCIAGFAAILSLERFSDCIAGFAAIVSLAIFSDCIAVFAAI